VGGTGGCVTATGGAAGAPACIPIAAGADISVEDLRAVESLGTMTKLVAHGDELTWLGTHEVMRATESTWTTPTTFVSDPALTDFAVDIDAVYWAVGASGSGGAGGGAGTTIVRRAITDATGPGVVAYQGPAAKWLAGSAARAGCAFLVDGSDPGSGPATYVHFTPGTGAAESVVGGVKNGGSSTPYVEKNGILFAASSDNGQMWLTWIGLDGAPGELLDEAKGGFSPSYVFAGDSSGTVLAAYGQIPLETIDAVTHQRLIIATSTEVTGLVVDGDSVFWTDSAGAVSVTPRAGGPRHVLAHETGQIGKPVVGAAYVYWLVYGVGIHRAAKP
jgi:hypothetical protein